MTAYKLFRIRRDGTLGSLFINRSAGKTAHTRGGLLTAMDTEADGHMASGTAQLRCSGF